MSNRKEKTKRVVYRKKEKISPFSQQFISKEKKHKTILKVPKDLWNTPTTGYTGKLTTNVTPSKYGSRITGKPAKIKDSKTTYITPDTETFKQRRQDKRRTKIAAITSGILAGITTRY